RGNFRGAVREVHGATHLDGFLAFLLGERGQRGAVKAFRIRLALLGAAVAAAHLVGAILADQRHNDVAVGLTAHSFGLHREPLGALLVAGLLGLERLGAQLAFLLSIVAGL